MDGAKRSPSVGDRPGIINRVIGRVVRRGVLKSQRGFTLIEMLAVLAILGVLVTIVSASVGGLGGRSSNARLAGDANTFNTAADRFFNDAFPQVYPVVDPDTDGDGDVDEDDALLAPAGDLGVREIDFDAQMPQDSTKTFVPDFVKDIPDSAGQVSWRINTNTGFVFATKFGAPLILPSDSRLKVTAAVRTKSAVGAPVTSNYTLELTMKKNQAAVEILEVEIPAGYITGGGAIDTANVLLGTLTATLGPDNDLEVGETIVFGGVLLSTTTPNKWLLVVNYNDNLSTSAATNKTIKATEPVRVHEVSITGATADSPGKLTLTMDRESGDEAHNTATETWKLVIFGNATETLANDDFIDSSDVPASGVDTNGIVTLTTPDPEDTPPVLASFEVFPNGGSVNKNVIINPSVKGVYRWLAQEQTTIDLEGVFDRVSGNQAVIITNEASQT